MVKSLQNQVVLVTGATRGIGKGIAIGLGEAGATVYITGRTLGNEETPSQTGTLLETKTAVEEAGGICIPVQVDHSDDEQIKQLFTQIEQEQNGQLDLLVNNVFAGVQPLAQASGTPFWQHDPSLWDAVNQVGLRSHYVSSIFAARLMSKRKQGLICTISSWGGMSYIFGAAYGVGKAGCDRLAADMAVELKSENITSVSLWPGIVGTEQISQLIQESNSENPTLRDRYNWESPLFVGRVIAAFVAQPNPLKLTGKVQIVAELAKRYKVVDQEGKRPASLRSLKFILPSALPFLRQYAWLIPDLKVPWFLLLWKVLPSPKI